MTAAEAIAALRARLHGLVIGQQEVVDQLLIALLADGHVLLEGAPGLAKTRLARLLAQGFQGRFNRVQFTPDLMPSDLTGTMIYDQENRVFTFSQGPLFAEFVLADEINRAPAKVQSALLEAMEERQITVADTSHPLGRTFFVIATQNPVEHEGTWELPQAQLDRFLVHVRIDYPDVASELQILDLAMAEIREAAGDSAPAKPVPITGDTLHEARRAVLEVHLSPLIKDYVARLVAATRNEATAIEGVQEHLAHPVSPRGSIGLVRAAMARAWLLGRDHVLPEDITTLAPSILRHRMGLTYRAEAVGVTTGAIVERLLGEVDAL